jgi:hypothetical protein
MPQYVPTHAYSGGTCRHEYPGGHSSVAGSPQPHRSIGGGWYSQSLQSQTTMLSPPSPCRRTHSPRHQSWQAANSPSVSISPLVVDSSPEASPPVLAGELVDDVHGVVTAGPVGAP